MFIWFIFVAYFPKSVLDANSLYQKKYQISKKCFCHFTWVLKVCTDLSHLPRNSLVKMVDRIFLHFTCTQYFRELTNVLTFCIIWVLICFVSVIELSAYLVSLLKYSALVKLYIQRSMECFITVFLWSQSNPAAVVKSYWDSKSDTYWRRTGLSEKDTRNSPLPKWWLNCVN